VGGTPDTAAAPKKWTIMHYCAADNNLTSFMVRDVNEMEAVGSTDMMNIIVMVDQGGENCKTHYITKDNDLNKINSPVLKDHGKTNMADPKVLGDFIKNSVEKYPAQHYALIISDHGAGWKGAVEDVSNHGWMTTPDIRQGIESSGKKLDLLGFDACLMATSEVAYEMKDATKFYVASEQTEGGNGWPYTPLLSKKSLEELDRALRSKLDVTPEEFAKRIVSTAEGDQGTLPTMSAMDMSKMKELADATNLFAGQIMLTDTPKQVFKDIANKTQSFYGLKDHFHFAEQVANSDKITDKDLKKSAKGMMDAIKSAVIAEEHSPRYPNAHGLTTELPTSGKVGSGYEKLQYAEHTLWDEAMNNMNKSEA
jgi:hypothetical protein